MPVGIYKRKPRGNYRDPIIGFYEKVIKTDGCWNWTSPLDKDGYGSYSPYRKKMSSHRYSYQINKGEIPENMTVDHLCRNRKCVNPEHLELVTNIENVMRGNGFCAKNARKTKCIKGHKLSGENLYIQKKTGKRYCRECDRKRGREYEARKTKNK